MWCINQLQGCPCRAGKAHLCCVKIHLPQVTGDETTVKVNQDFLLTFLLIFDKGRSELDILVAELLKPLLDDKILGQDQIETNCR